MKTKSILTSIAFLLTITFYSQVSAQKNLNAIIKKCENNDHAQVSLILQKNRETKEFEKRIVSITFKDDEKLLNEILNAFEKDKEDAVQVIEEKKNGKVIPSLYEFYENNSSLKFSIDVSKKGEVNFSLIERNMKNFKGG